MIKKPNYKGVVNPFDIPQGGTSKITTKKTSWTKQRTNNFERVPKELVGYIKINHSVELFDEVLTRAPMRSGGRPTYVCPNCSNGTGDDGTGMELLKYKDGAPHCWCARCGETFDIFKVYQHTQGSNYNFRKLIYYFINRFDDVRSYSERLGFGINGCYTSVSAPELSLIQE